MDKLLPQMVSQLKVMANDMEGIRALIINTYGTSDLQSTLTTQTFDDMINVGLDFDKSRSDDFFYIPDRASRTKTSRPGCSC